jgi:hypothetical protein
MPIALALVIVVVILSFCSIEIAEALTPIYCVFIPDNIGFIRNRHRSIEKKAITNGTQ